MQQATVIVCEQQGLWAVAWRQLLSLADNPLTAGHERLRVYEVRIAAEARQALVDHPTSLLAMEATETNLDAVLELLLTVTCAHPRVAAVIMTEAKLRKAHELLWREYGAQQVIASRFELPSAVQVARRHAARYAEQRAASETRSWRERIFARLPWSKYASPSFDGQRLQHG